MAPSAPPDGPRHRSMSSGSIDELGTPIPHVKVDLTEDDFRESAYEILVAANGFALSARSVGSARSKADKSITAAAASRMKKALGLKSKIGSFRKARTTAEIMRDQMLIPEAADSRIRRALSRAAAGQASKRTELMLVPLELLQNTPASAFQDSQEHTRWLKRQLRVLEAGLLAHPLVRVESGSTDAVRLRQSLKDMYNKMSDTGKNTESIQALRSAAMARATRHYNGENGEDVLHWVDGYPMNVNLYATLLGACFDTQEEGSVLDEIDDVMDMIKKTWGVLGIDQYTHNLLFMWVLFRQFVYSGQTELDLLGAAENQMNEVIRNSNNIRPEQRNLLVAMLTTMQSWAEKRLFLYHDSFPGGQGPLEGLLSMAVSAGEVLQVDVSQDNRRRRNPETNVAIIRVDLYVRSSIRTAFAQMMESVDTRRKAADEPISALTQLANDTSALAADEVENFSPILKRWHPYAGGIAAATLHACYSREIKQYMSGVTGLTPDTVQVLEAADQLEKSLVQIAVEDGVNAEDGGKGLIREMPPFEADRAVGDLARKWVDEKLQMLREWVNRNVEQEQWDPEALRERCAPSSVEVLRIVNETLDAYFALPVSQFPELLQDLVSGLDQALENYANRTISPCGTKDLLVPPISPLTRCKTKRSWFGKSRGDHKTSRKPRNANRNGQQTNEVYDLPHLCVRINTLHHIMTEVGFTEKKIRFGWQKDPTLSTIDKHVPTSHKCAEPVDSDFHRTRGLVKEGIDNLVELAAYRAVFSDLRTVLWDGLYVGGVANARIDGVTEQLDVQLGIIAASASERLRNRVVAALMRACFEGYLLVLMAGGPSRMFTVDDADMLREDLQILKDLFKADGDGLPGDKVEREAAIATAVLSQFSLSSNELIQRFISANGGAKSGSKPPLPPTTGDWSASDPNTLLRVLCYRADDTASKFLKKTYRLPKNE